MKRATLMDVANKAGVSKATVSYVLNNSQKTISTETRERVMKAVEELEYIPNLGAATLSNKNSKLIGVVVPQTEPGSRLMFQNSFYSEVLGAIEYHARLKGYHVIISATDINESYMKLVMERNLDGVIVIGMYPDDFYQQFKKIEVPVVLIDSYCTDSYFHNVRIDDFYGGYLATNYLIKQGHHKIGILSGVLHENGVVKKRIEGYRKALEENGIDYKRQLVFEGKVDYDSGIESAKRIVKEQTDITALVTTADILAIGAMKGFFEGGVKIPDEISIVGFDDLEISKYMNPGLTTVKQDISKKGEVAVEFLANSIEDKEYPCQEIVLPFTLIERGTVKKLK